MKFKTLMLVTIVAALWPTGSEGGVLARFLGYDGKSSHFEIQIANSETQRFEASAPGTIKGVTEPNQILKNESGTLIGINMKSAVAVNHIVLETQKELEAMGGKRESIFPFRESDFSKLLDQHYVKDVPDVSLYLTGVRSNNVTVTIDPFNYRNLEGKSGKSYNFSVAEDGKIDWIGPDFSSTR
jgi:hypothetical protein